MALPADPQFDVARKRAATQENANVQAQQDAIARRMASQGGGPSGAQVKLETQARDESAKRLATANEGIDTAETAEKRRIAEIQDARDFTTKEREASQGFAHGERLGSQDFASLQAEAQRKYATGERLSSQEFAALEAGKQRGFAHDERLGSQEFASGENKLQRDEAIRQFDKNYDEAIRQFDKNYAFQDAQALNNLQFRKMAFDQEQQNFLDQMRLSQNQFDWQRQIDDKNLILAGRIQSANERDPGLLGSIFGGLTGSGGGGSKRGAKGPLPW